MAGDGQASQTAPVSAPEGPPPFTPRQPGQEKFPHCRRGQWSEWPGGWLDALYPDGGWDGRAVRQAGYGAITCIGLADSLQLVLYRNDKRESNGGPPYFIEIRDGGSVDYITAGTLPDAMDLMARWAPAVTAEILTEVFNELVTNTDPHAGWIPEILAGVPANEPYIERRAGEMREQRSREIARRREARRQREQAGGSA